jgi:subtilisin family serine protease
MRKWHHLVIKLHDALQLIPSLSQSSQKIHVGIIEGSIQYDFFNNDINSNQVSISHYRAKHQAFADIDDGNLNRKVFSRFRYRKMDTYTESMSLSSEGSYHTTSVDSIIGANDFSSIDGLQGIISNVRMINVGSHFESFLAASINNISGANLSSLYCKKSPINPAVVLGNVMVIRMTGQPNVSYHDALPFKAPTAELLGISNQEFLYTQKAVSILSNSSHPNNFTANDVAAFNFMLEEIFAYGRDGRGVLYITSAGNNNENIDQSRNNRINTKSVKPIIVAASYISPNENNYNLLQNYPEHPETLIESKSLYSNYGDRIDVTAPSSSRAKPSTDEVAIYAATTVNGGELGNDNQVLVKSIVGIAAATLGGYNYSKIQLNNIKGILKGQTVEFGNSGTFFHEIRTVTQVITETDGEIKKFFIKINKDLEFTRVFTNQNNVQWTPIGTESRVTILKITATRHGNSTSKMKITDRRGIGSPNKKGGDKFQWAYVYPADEFDSGIDTQIQGVSIDGINYVIEITNVLPEGNNFIIIPGQMEIMVKAGEGSVASEYGGDSGSNEFTCIEGTLDGFFEGQQIYFSAGSVSSVAHISRIDGQKMITPHFNASVNSKLTAKSQGYGDYTNSFGGTSAATPIIAGVAALLIATNPHLNAAEVKHILKQTADHIGSTGYQIVSDLTKYNYGYTTNVNFGTGRVNAFNAVKMAKNWSSTQKPKLEIFDDPDLEGFNSPDIVVNSDVNNINIDLNSATDTTIKATIRNTGDRNSFVENDIRLLMVSVRENEGQYNPNVLKFKFPDFWYNNPKKSGSDLYSVTLLDVKEIGIINAGSSKDIEFSFTPKQLKIVKDQLNYLGNYRTFILVHLAPFDGEFTIINGVNLSLENFRYNKQLTCKEIIFTDVKIIEGTGALPGNTLDIALEQEVIEKSFTLSFENISETDLENIQIKATKVNRSDQSEDSVILSRNTSNEWVIEGGLSPNWIAFQSPTEVQSYHSGYKHIQFPHIITLDDTLEEITIETLNV